MSALGVSRRSTIGLGKDFDAKVRLSTSAVAAGTGSINSGIIGRVVDTDNYYVFRIRFGPTQNVYASVQKSVAGTLSAIGTEVTVAGLTRTANSFYWVRATAVGSTLQMKIWLDGKVEPAE